MKKRIVSFLLTLSMVLNMLPSSALTATAAENGNSVGPDTKVSCTDHGSVTPVVFEVKQSMATEGHQLIGKGTVYFCPTCGKACEADGWTGNNGNSDLQSQIYYDVTEKKVNILCKGEGDPVYESVPLADGCVHIYEKQSTVAPTCETEGYSVYKCVNCGDTYNDDTLPKLGHKWDKGTETKAATCKETGVMTYHCTRQGCEESKTEEIPIDPDNHDLKEETITPASCTQDGLKKITCNNGCGYEKTEPIPGGHDWETYEKLNPTCITAGYEKQECQECHEQQTVPVAPTGTHSWEVDTDTATCDKDGIVTYKCVGDPDCTASYQEDSPKKGHDWGSWTTTKDPSCTEEGEEQRTCVRGCVETRPIAKTAHDYNENYVCNVCGKSMEEIQEILDKIAQLPKDEEDELSADAVNETNAQAVYNNATEIQEMIAAIKNGSDQTLKDALAANVSPDTEAGIQEEKEAATEYLYSIDYDPTPGQQQFQVAWNDNNEDTGKREPVDTFLESANVKLHYEIVSEDGTTVVSSGDLASQQDFDDAFGFIYDKSDDPKPTISEFLSIEAVGADYVISTSVDLPVSYKSIYTDFTTLETTTENFKIKYSITLENPVPDDYIVTAPERTSEPVTLQNREKAILTKLATWEAEIEWLDDDNRSAYGGTSTEARPRLDAEALKAASAVYVYPEGYNVPEGDLVTGDFGYQIDTETNKISLTGLPAFDNDGNPLNYYIKQNDVAAANADVVPGNKYEVTYENVGNVASKNNGVYNGGKMTELLTNTIPFTVNKIWADGRDPKDRPNAKYYIWRIIEDYNGDDLMVDTEFCYAIANTKEYYDVPKAGGETSFVREIDGITYYLFPMYDNQGRKYIYFGKEKGVPGEYTTTIDNSEANASDKVKAAFATDSNKNYFLNGGEIANVLGNRTGLSVSKEFHALSLQNKLDATHPITATFLLQKKGPDGIWVTANCENDHVSVPTGDSHVHVGSDQSVTVTLDGFTAEDMSDAYSGITVDKFDATYNPVSFRFVETGVSVNGVSASYDPANWVDDGEGGLVYDGDIIVYDGQTSTVLGDDTTQTSGSDDTTALFTSVGKNNHFSNTLIGEYQVNIKKYFYDADGNNISADPSLANAEVQFQIYRDDQPYEVVTLTQADLAGPRGAEYWAKLLNYDRYDEEGREYRFKVAEIGVTGDNRQWHRQENYTVKVVEYPTDSDILVKRLETVYVNGIGPGGIEFNVEKEWLDDSDLSTRNPVVATLYRFRNADGTLLDTPEVVLDDIELNLGNNWFQQRGIAKNGDNDTIDNYVVLEKGIKVNGRVVPTSYNFDLTSENLRTYHDQIVAGITETGMTGSKAAEDDNWDGLEYRYRLFEERTMKEGLADFVLTNLRVGTQDYILEKSWVAGGRVRKGKFGLFLGGEKIASFTIDTNATETSVIIANIEWFNSKYEAKYNAGDITVEVYGSGISRGAEGNITESIAIRGLDKFNDKGAQIEYAIDEISIFNDTDEEFPVRNGACKVDNETYNVGVSSSKEMAPGTKHRAPDLYTYKIQNKLSNSYDLTSNKVWRDGKNRQIPRPDICFSVYRLSTKDEGLNEVLGDPDAMSEYLAGKMTESNKVVNDKYWDTHINDYWWTCDIENVPQYDGEGFPYVYFAVEKLSNGKTYKGYYCNYTVDEHQDDYRPVNPSVRPITTQAVFGVPNDQLEAKEGHVFILADGINTDSNGSFADYYSATAVNRPEALRNVTGKKLWKLPSDWVIPEEEMPEVQIELYRTLDEISYSSYTSSVDYAAAIKTAASTTGGLLETTTASYSANNYKFTFPDEESEPLYPKYDEWGSVYYYYTLEKPNNYETFPEEEVVYEDNDFNITNVFKATPPYVEVSVKKNWVLSPELLADLEEYGLDAIAGKDFVPAELTLSGKPLNARGSEIAKSNLKFRTVTMDPGAMNSQGWADIDGDGTLDTHYVFNAAATTLEATYTFKDYKNAETGETEKLPYYWLGNLGINYYVSEKHNDGYTIQKSTEKVNIDPTRTDAQNIVIHYNANPFEITNEYDGFGENFKFTFTKTWNDNYVDNDEWRPDQVKFVIKRKVGSRVDAHYSLDVTLNKTAFTNTNVWSWDSDAAGLKLLKYDPAGNEYTYFVYSETVNGTTVTIDDISKSIPERTVGNYYLQDFSNKNLTNKLTNDVAVEADKDWTVNGTAVSTYSYDDFSDLRAMGVFPENVKFVLQRKYTSQAESAYDYVSAAGVSDASHIVTIGGRAYVGHMVDIAGADAHNYKKVLAPSMKWENLPTGKGTFTYDYRVVEILTWADGTETQFVKTQTTTTHGVQPTITLLSHEGNNYKYDLANDVQPLKVKIAKKWVDNNGSQNTRPTTMTVTIKPLDTNGEAATDGRTFTLTTSGNATSNTDANMYYSDEFYIPANVAKTYGVTNACYAITETYTSPTGANYTKTITSDDGHVYQDDDDTWIFELENTFTDIKTVDLDATKTWSNETPNWADITRPAVTFKLQYYDRTAGWKDMTKGDTTKDSDISKFTTQTTQDVEQTVTYNSTTQKYEVSGWKNMRKYWISNSTDGVAEKIRYRAVEVTGTTSGNSSYTHSDQEFQFSDTTTTEDFDSSVNIANTLQKKEIFVKKTWTEGTASMSKAELQKLINLNAVPEKITFEIQYHLDGETTWKKIPETTSTPAAKTFNTVDIFDSAKTTGRNVPRYDKNGKDILYRVVETSVTYKNGQSYDVVYSGNTGTIGSITAQIQEFSEITANKTLNFSNDYAYVNKEITKTWRDEHNRDTARAHVKFTLYRDGEAYCTIDTDDVGTGTTVITKDNAICTVTKNNDDTWTIKWDKLPKYQNGKQPASGNESVYTWAETTGVANDIYNISYNETTSDRTAPVSGSNVYNTYQPKRGDIAAQKNWTQDSSDKMGTRPEKIYLKLQYKNASGSWVDVTQNTLITVDGKTHYQNADAAVAYTTSPVGWIEATKANSYSVSWADLPVYKNVNGTRSKIDYRVIEGKKSGDTITAIDANGKLNGYTVTYSNVNLDDNPTAAKAGPLTNKLDTTTLELSKVWSDSYSSIVRPASVTFEVQYRKTGEESWKAIPAGVDDTHITVSDGKSYVVVTSANNWKTTVANLPRMDAAGTIYEYRATEAKITYSWGDVAVNDSQKIVGPYSIEDITKEAAYANSKYSVSHKNTLDVGKLTVTKTWKDGNNRDDGEKTIKVRLYRENQKTVNGVSTTELQKVEDVELKVSNNWTYTWENLPIRNNNATDKNAAADRSKYYVRELDANNNPIDEDGEYEGQRSVEFTVTYTSDKVTVDAPATQGVTNTHTPKVINVSATKNWGTNDKDKIDVRPTSVRFKLEYSLDGSTWTEFPAANILSGNVSVLINKDAENVYMVDTATVTQTLSESNNWTANWNNLTAYVMVDGVRKNVKYRAVEITEDLKNYTPANEGKSSAVDVDTGTDTTKSVTISNELIRGSITATKKFTANGTELTGDQLYKLVKVYKVLPETLTVTLSYYDGSTLKEETGQIVFNATTKKYGTCTFNNLPIADAAGNLIEYTLTDTAASGVYDFIAYGTTEEITIPLNTKTRNATITNDFETGKLQVEKKWVDDGNRDNGRKEITVYLFRDGVQIDEHKLNKANSWKYTWEDLPIYQKTKDAEDDVLYKSVYTIKEAGETELKFTGDNNVEYTVKYESPLELRKNVTEKATATNRHDVYRFTIKANKKWLGDQSGDPYGQRPDVVLKLQWTTKTNPAETDWTDVPSEVDSWIMDGKNVGTSSEPEQTLYSSDYTGQDVWKECKWEDLPANVIVTDPTTEEDVSTKVYYRVVESEGLAPYYSLASQIISYDKDNKTLTTEVENTLDPTTFTVEKKWDDTIQVKEGVAQIAKPDEIKVVLQYKTASDTAWTTPAETETAYYAVLNASNGWKKSWSGLSKKYSYRALELSMTYIGKGEGGSDVIVTPGTGQTDSGTIGVYDFSDTTEAADKATKTEITNELIRGDLKISKVWHDGNDRDHIRPTTVTFNIYRDGSNDIYATKTVDVATDGSINCVFEDLPVYKDIQGTVKSTYKVEEAAVTGYEISYEASSTSLTLDKTTTTETTVTNTHDNFRFPVKATKTWLEDNTDHYGLRPLSVKLKLQYSLDGSTWADVEKVDAVPTPAADAGTKVYTTSALVQTIAKKQSDTNPNLWDGPEWENLPAYALYNGVSTLVKYKIVEVDKDFTAYRDTESDVLTYENYSEETAPVGNVSNSLVGKTQAEVKKVWTSKYTTVYPDKITVQLQYTAKSDPTEDDWIDVPKNGVKDLVHTDDPDTDWYAQWPALRKDLQYRVLEISMTYGEGETATVYEASPKAALTGTIGTYNFTTAYVPGETGTKCTLTNSNMVGKIQVTKAWEDGVNRDGIRPARLTFDLYRDGTKIDDKTVSIADDGTMDTCIFENLPVYKDGSTVKSEYYVTERANTDYTIRYTVTASDTIKLTEGQSSTAAVTNNHKFYVFNFDVTKTWDDNTNYYGLRPEDVKLKLQYSLDGSDWNDVTEKLTAVPDPATDNGKRVFTTSELTQTLKAFDAIDEAGNVWGTAQWKNLPAYALNSSGVSTLVQYRVVEAASVPAVYTSTKSSVVTYNDAKDETDLTIDGDVKNTLTGKTAADVEKTWPAPDKSYVKFLPDKVTVQLQYATKAEPEEADWMNVPKNSVKDLTAADNWKASWTDLRSDYKYRVIEISMTFDETTIAAIPGDTKLSGTVGGYDYTTDVTAGSESTATKVTIENKQILGKVEVKKTWEDAKDRDGIRPRSLTFQLYRDGEKIEEKTATVTAEGIQTCEFVDLPVFKDGTTTKSKYYVTETAVDEYTTSYTVTSDSQIELIQNESKDTPVKNRHEIHLFDIQTTKFWDDNKDPYGLRPKAVTLKLQWTTETNPVAADWDDVTEINAVPDPAEDDGTVVFTTSDLKQELKAGEIIGPDGNPVWGPARWENLPANVLVGTVRDNVLVYESKPVYYRVIEDENPSEAYGSKQVGPVSYSDAEEGEVDIKGEDGVQNILEHTVEISVAKTWYDDDQLYTHRPDSIRVQLQYREDAESEWKDTPETTRDGQPYNKGTDYLTEANGWKFSWDGLRADYDYRVVERAMIYGETEVTADPIDDGPNGQIGGYNYTTTGTAKEGSEVITDYDVTNTLITGQLAVTKSWTDCKDRDGLRPETLTFELYRDVDPAEGEPEQEATEAPAGEEQETPGEVTPGEVTPGEETPGEETPDTTPKPIATKEVAVTAEGIEECVFDKLPVYKDGTKELSRYYVVEKDVDGYVTSYEVTLEDPANLEYNEETETYEATTPIDNRHESLRFNVEATKTWEDDDNYYGMRPESVDLKLVYATDPEAEDWTDVTALDEVPGPETDDGTVVFTTSELIQNLTSADALEEDDNVWGTVRWENLPGFVLVEEEGKMVSKAVYYKVVEVESPSSSYDSVDMGPVCYDDAKDTETLTIGGTVINPLTNVTCLLVEKNWIDNKQKQLGKYIASKVNVELQYRASAEEEWQPVPENGTVVLTKENDWNYTWNGLRDDYKYRAVETSFEKGKTVFKIAKVLKDKGYTYSTTIGEFASIAETAIEQDSDGNKTYHTVMFNKLNEHPGPKTGDESDFRFYGSLLATSFFALVACAFVARKRREEEMAE